MIDGYPGQNNAAHYWGLWYQPPTVKLDLPLEVKDGSERLVDFAPGTLAKVANVKLQRFPKSAGVEGDPGKEVTVYDIDAATIWKDREGRNRQAAEGFRREARSRETRREDPVCD